MSTPKAKVGSYLELGQVTRLPAADPRILNRVYEVDPLPYLTRHLSPFLPPTPLSFAYNIHLPFPFTFVPFWLYEIALCFRSLLVLRWKCHICFPLERRLLRHYGVKAQALPILPGVN
jgi:hypothetical protein